MKRLILVLSSFIVVACGGKKKDSEPQSSGPSQNQAFDLVHGIYKSDCLPHGEGQSMKRQTNFLGLTKKFDTSVTVFAGPDCKVGDLAVETRVKGAIEYGDWVEGQENAIHLTMVVESATVWVGSKRQADASAAKLFGYTDWKSKSTQDVLGRKSSENSDEVPFTKGQIIYTLIKRDGAKLLMGDETSLDEAGRPTKLNETRVYNKT